MPEAIRKALISVEDAREIPEGGREGNGLADLERDMPTKNSHNTKICAIFQMIFSRAVHNSKPMSGSKKNISRVKKAQKIHTTVFLVYTTPVFWRQRHVKKMFPKLN